MVDIFKITKEGVALASADEKPAHDLFVKLDDYQDLQNTIIDLRACLRTCLNAAKGGLDRHR